MKYVLGFFIYALTASFSESYAFENHHRVADKTLKKFMLLVQGEFDNYNQINFETNQFLPPIDIPKQKHARLYLRIAKINAPQLGEHVFYQQLHSGGKHKPIYRQSIQVVSANYQNNTVSAQNYTFKQPQKYQNLWLKNDEIYLTNADLKTVGQDCESTYRLVDNMFVGGINQQTCKVASKKFDFLQLSTSQVISKNSFWHLEEGFLPSGKMLFGREDNIHHQLKRVKNFSCWAAFKTNRTQTNGEADWDFKQNIQLHDQGDIVEITTSSNPAKTYVIRLKETIFPSGERPDVFEMFIHPSKNTTDELATEESATSLPPAIAYTWTNSGAERLGVNLRWMQASCHHKPQTTNHKIANNHHET